MGRDLHAGLGQRGGLVPEGGDEPGGLEDLGERAGGQLWTAPRRSRVGAGLAGLIARARGCRPRAVATPSADSPAASSRAGRKPTVNVTSGGAGGLPWLVNDDYGHDVGDAVLAETGRPLSWIFRRGDVVSGVRGEEFLVPLPDTDRPMPSSSRRRSGPRPCA
jgi:hypothetical protein